MGEVWCGHDEDGAPLAFKLLLPELMSDQEIVARFMRERSVLIRVDSPFVVRVRDLVAERGHLAIVMDFVEGSDLRRELRRRRTFPPAEAVATTVDILTGLGAAHELGIIHHDLKPENVLLDRHDGGYQPKISDFGIAGLMGASTRLTTRQGILGTPLYMAPEMIEEGVAGPPADVYAAGIVLYELLCGVTPFTGRAPLAIMRAHVDLLPARPPDLTDELWSVLAAMLAKDPAARAGADQLRALLPDLHGLPASPPLAAPPPATPLPGTPTLATPLPATLPPGTPPPATAGTIGNGVPAERAPASPSASGSTPPGGADAIGSDPVRPGDSSAEPGVRRRRRLLVVALGIVVVIGATVAAVVSTTGSLSDPSKRLLIQARTKDQQAMAGHPAPTASPSPGASARVDGAGPPTPTPTSAPTSVLAPASVTAVRVANPTVLPPPRPAGPVPAAPPTAAAAQGGLGRTFADIATHSCLDSNAQGQVYTLGCNQGNYQHWVYTAGNGGVRLRNAQTNNCVGSRANPAPDGSRYQGTVYATGCDGGAAQLWTTSSDSFGMTFRNAATGECLDSNADGRVYTQGCNNGDYQRWG